MIDVNDVPIDTGGTGLTPKTLCAASRPKSKLFVHEIHSSHRHQLYLLPFSRLRVIKVFTDIADEAWDFEVRARKLRMMLKISACLRPAVVADRAKVEHESADKNWGLAK